MAIVVVETALVLALLALSACFSSSETALFSLRPHEMRRLEREPTARSLRAVALLKNPHRLLVSLLVGNTLVNVAAASLGHSVASRCLAENQIAVSVTAMSLLLLVAGEVTPKTYAVKNPVRASTRLARFAGACVTVLGPLEGGLNSILKLVAHRSHRSLKEGEPSAGERIDQALALGHSQGVVDRFEGEVLRGLFRVSHLSVGNVMTPRTEVFAVSSRLTLGEAVGSIKASGFSRILVTGADDPHAIEGVLYVKDMLYGGHGPDVTTGQAARKPVFVPETKSVASLMREFESGAYHFAVVIDEYGVFTGVVTMDDVLAEITGRGVSTHGDRYGDKYSYRKRSRSGWEVSGRMAVSYFNALTGSALAAEGAETVAGLVIRKLGRIPAPGDHLAVGSVRFTVLDADRVRVKRLLADKVRR